MSIEFVVPDYTYIDYNVAAMLVDDWNEKGGNKTEGFTFLDLYNQARLVKEEAIETYDATKTLKDIESGVLTLENLETLKEEGYDPLVEILDGAMDSVVVLFRFISLLEIMGYDTSKAWTRVMDSLDSKIMENLTQEELTYAKENYGDFHTVTTEMLGKKYHTIRDANNKIKKPKQFVPVDLSDLVPETVKNMLEQ